MSTLTPTPPTAARRLSVRRLNAMRAGYLLMGLGLAVVKWPLLADAHTLPLFEGVTWALLTAMSLLALLGLRHPVAMLPVLLFETTWKLLWLAVVALPRCRSTAGSTRPPPSVVVNCSLVVVIIAVTPWRPRVAPVRARRRRSVAVTPRRCEPTFAPPVPSTQ